MQDYDWSTERSYFIDSKINELELINNKIDELNLIKSEITENIIGALEHKHEGQKTYYLPNRRIEVKTPVNYCLNKRLYEEYESLIPKQYNPVSKSVSYHIDKRVCSQALLYAPVAVKEILCDLIEKKHAKPSIVIKGE